MIRAFTIEDVRAAEAEAKEGLPEGELMARAAAGLAKVALARLSMSRPGASAPGDEDEGEGRRVVVLVGSGDNGGDALYAAAHLAEAGANVAVVLVGSTQHAAGLAAADAAGAVHLEWRAGAAPDEVRLSLAEADIVIDGIAGIGGAIGLKTFQLALPDMIGEDAYVIAVDLPSGCDPMGRQESLSIFAEETVTFSLVKPVHLLPATELAVGLLTVVDIGVREPGTSAVERLTHEDLADLWPVPGPYDDKYSRGVLGLVAGGDTYTGAAVLSATAAVTSGVGMLRYVGPEAPTSLLRSAVPEAVYGNGRVQAWAIGSGMDLHSAHPDQLRVAQAALASDLPVLLDAGGLDLLTGPREAATLLTPHAGELLRLARRLDLLRGADGEPLPHEAVQWLIVDVAQHVADRLNATVLLKGVVTVVIPPSATGLPIRSQSDGPSWLAVAGSGDVLAGLAGTLLASGLSPLDAGSVAAGVHGLAGHRANPGGPIRALDVAHAIGPTVADLLRGA